METNMSKKELEQLGWAWCTWLFYQEYCDNVSVKFTDGLIGRLMQAVEMLPLNEVQLTATKKTIKQITRDYDDEARTWLYGRIPKEDIQKIKIEL